MIFTRMNKLVIWDTIVKLRGLKESKLFFPLSMQRYKNAQLEGTTYKINCLRGQIHGDLTIPGQTAGGK